MHRTSQTRDGRTFVFVCARTIGVAALAAAGFAASASVASAALSTRASADADSCRTAASPLYAVTLSRALEGIRGTESAPASAGATGRFDAAPVVSVSAQNLIRGLLRDPESAEATPVGTLARKPELGGGAGPSVGSPALSIGAPAIRTGVLSAAVERALAAAAPFIRIPIGVRPMPPITPPQGAAPTFQSSHATCCWVPSQPGQPMGMVATQCWISGAGPGTPVSTQCYRPDANGDPQAVETQCFTGGSPGSAGGTAVETQCYAGGSPANPGGTAVETQCFAGAPGGGSPGGTAIETQCFAGGSPASPGGQPIETQCFSGATSAGGGNHAGNAVETQCFAGATAGQGTNHHGNAVATQCFSGASSTGGQNHAGMAVATQCYSGGAWAGGGNHAGNAVATQCYSGGSSANGGNHGGTAVETQCYTGGTPAPGGNHGGNANETVCYAGATSGNRGGTPQTTVCYKGANPGNPGGNAEESVCYVSTGARPFGDPRAGSCYKHHPNDPPGGTVEQAVYTTLDVTLNGTSDPVADDIVLVRDNASNPAFHQINGSILINHDCSVDLNMTTNACGFVSDGPWGATGGTPLPFTLIAGGCPSASVDGDLLQGLAQLVSGAFGVFDQETFTIFQVTPGYKPDDDFGGRHYQHFGVGEELTLTTAVEPDDGAGHPTLGGITWASIRSVGGVPDPFTNPTSDTAKYKAPDVEVAWEVIALQITGGRLANAEVYALKDPATGRRFTQAIADWVIVKPSDSYGTLVAGSKASSGPPSSAAGFLADVFLNPKDVSFHFVKVAEWTADGVGHGYWGWANGQQHPETSPHATPSGGDSSTGCNIGTDTVLTPPTGGWAPPYTTVDFTGGDFHWDIPLKYLDRNDANPVLINTNTQSQTIDGSGNVTISKFGITAP